MKNLMDLHTHTIACSHAYSTLNENIARASEIGLEVFGWSEHGYGMKDTTNRFVFSNFKVIPKVINDVRILKGMEANIFDFRGTIYEQDMLPVVDYVIASLHRNCIAAGSKKENTTAVIGAIENKYVNILGHLDDGYYIMDFDEIARVAKEYNVAIEINNSSLVEESFRINSKSNILEMLEKCDKYGTTIIMNTDTHFSTEVGDVSKSEEIIKEYGFNKNLILNYNIKNLEYFINTEL
ncbi:phosphatase [Miniphocaeibacter massiliensis]|uniref:phosphatase n=1 Tax=Miniphocaeibacter massiliensis TaxID=2041841 RepID=UPI000C06A9D3|nr:phosphatase [Miniphocaeibacter massiliensis]